MTPLIIYFIKVNVALMVLYFFYKLTFGRDTFFGLRRLLLLLICVTPFTYPLFDYSHWFAEDSSPVVYAIVGFYTKVLPEIIITPQTVFTGMDNLFSWSVMALSFLYMLGVFLLIARTGLEIYRIRKSLRQCQATFINGYKVYQLQKKGEPYSFFHWIFINPKSFTQKEINEILIHERTHVREYHSLDIMLAQLMIILCWFNPFAWLIRSEMRMNHEYLADKSVIVSGHDKKTYQYHLIGLTVSPQAAANLYNNFSVLPLKNRIKMLNKRRTRNIMKSKYLMFIPVVALLIFFSNCTSKTKQSEMEKTETSEVKTDTLANTQSGTKNIIDPLGGNDVFDMVEEMPTFPGGDKALMEYLRSVINYPPTALKNGTQGRVYVGFVINADGTLSNVQIARGVDPELDKEAIRVVKIMPKWTPGKQNGEAVRVKYMLPISFKLS